jgi:hypothetical protein
MDGGLPNMKFLRMGLVLVLAMAWIGKADAQQASLKSAGVFKNRVEACSNAKNAAAWWAKRERTAMEIFLGSEPDYETSECNCALESPTSSDWVCEVTARMKRRPVSAPVPAPGGGQRVNDTRNYTGVGGSDMEACVHAKDYGVSAIRSIEGGAIQSFDRCDCRMTSTVTLTWSCSVDMHYTRPVTSGSKPFNF